MNVMQLGWGWKKLAQLKRWCTQASTEMQKPPANIRFNSIFPTFHDDLDSFAVLGLVFIRDEGPFPSHFLLHVCFYLQLDINQLMMTSVNVSQSLSPIHRPVESPGGGSSSGGSSSSSSGVGGPSGAAVEQSPVDRTKGFFPDESEPLLRCDSTSSKDSALSRNGSFITKGKREIKPNVFTYLLTKKQERV